ncbi:TetR family transcriptional regulator [Cellulosimicrobium funkei]|nr:TetR family transcriptional regulator [Cellulosimicrobium funkei]
MAHDSPDDQSPAVAVVVDQLIRQGYEATSVDELAEAAGISRSTFFRKYGSKEGMVFADHDRILRRLSDFLSNNTSDPLLAVAEAGGMVFDHHVSHRMTSLARYQLLQQVPALRERELVTSHRYERAFRLHLEKALPQSSRKEYGAVAVAASTVAVHNAFLRQWLRSPDAVPVAELRRRLTQELTALAETFRPGLYESAPAQDRPPAVIVTVCEAGADRQAILDAVSRALP